ncbi:hypothetical protein [Rudanella lutea]|uniref:hypothetical protein n=1 Tax=Rudanella lutea TaxID=451374 RepID=UPI0003674CD8|nr:hypothetical protein [Rudanella lutea]
MRMLPWLVVGLVSAGKLLASPSSHTPHSDHPSFTCNYTGARAPQVVCDQLISRSNGHAERVVDRILKPIGLMRNFKIMECTNTQNCFATVLQGQRFIIYDGAFMQRIETVTDTDWSAISIMAHEIGHHLQGHTIDGKGGQPQKEIEADRFSGFVLHQLGASLEDSYAAIRALGSEHPTPTHPARAARMEAIRKGWLEAEELYPRLTGSHALNRPSEPKASRPVAQRPVAAPTTNAPSVATRNPDASAPAVRPALAKPAASAASRVGCLSGNCQNGFGVFVSTTREKYVGEFAERARHGQGIEYYPDGKIKYKGAFAEGERAGFGTYYFRNGDRYVGQFSDSAPNGKGTYYFSDGDRFVGLFRDGKRNGFGVLYNADGRRQESGEYEDDELTD